MSINKTTLFAYLRRAPFGGRLSQAQVDGVEAILAACIWLAVVDLRWIAYIMATAFHETGGTMQPIREAFGKSDADTIARLDRAWKAGKLGKVKTPYWRDGWFGRGYVQLTHLANYIKMGARLALDLVKNPSLMLEAGPAAKALVVGMVEGMFRADRQGPFTLRRFFNAGKADPVAARDIVNGGRDKAKLIATYYTAFLDALQAADSETPQPTDVVKEDAKPDDVPVAQSGSLGTIGTAAAGAAATAAGGVATAAVSGVDNQWALAAFALILVLVLICGGVGLWLVLTGRFTILKGKAAQP